MNVLYRVAMAGLAAGAVSLLWRGRPRRDDAAHGSADVDADAELDDDVTKAVEDTFPASDPYNVGSPSAQQADRPLHRRPAEIDNRSVERQVELLERKRRALGLEE